jgi:hypothetical protein
MAAERLDDSRITREEPRPPGDPRPPAHDAAPVVAPTAVRQGKADNRVRYILGIGIALVAIAFIVIYFVTPSPNP